MASENYKEQLKRFGERLASLRKEKNLSYRKLAQVCDIDFSDIKKYEKGEINLTFASLTELSKGLDVPLKDLMDF
jgi:transcriptional regulator with XRE-family HTH domain